MTLVLGGEVRQQTLTYEGGPVRVEIALPLAEAAPSGTVRLDFPRALWPTVPGFRAGARVRVTVEEVPA